MEEKIKIYISKRTKDILWKDMELFEFFKRNGKLNQNDFLNELIMNYYEKYQNDQKNYREGILRVFASSDINDAETLTDQVMAVFHGGAETSRQKKEVTISLKPTKKSSSIISYIQNELTKNISLSGYFRNLLDSYVSMPQDEREKIIFRETYDIIRKAILEKKKISVATYRKPTYFHRISPYALSSSREELFNYLLGAKENRICSFRVSRIRTIVIEEEKSFFTKEQLVLLKKMEQYGPQFMISREQEIIVRLGQRGKELYQALYLHRPAVDHMEGDLYYFYCSEEQIRQYFSRFGKYAEIVQPEYLREEMKQFYKEAYEMYKGGGNERVR